MVVMKPPTDDQGRPFWLNATHTRLVRQGTYGVSCYEGEVEDGVFCGTHRGVVFSREEAGRWLAGDDVELTVVYKDADSGTPPGSGAGVQVRKHKGVNHG